MFILCVVAVLLERCIWPVNIWHVLFAEEEELKKETIKEEEWSSSTGVTIEVLPSVLIVLMACLPALRNIS